MTKTGNNEQGTLFKTNPNKANFPKAQMMVCHSCESRNPRFLMVLDSATKPALSEVEWVRNDRSDKAQLLGHGAFSPNIKHSARL